ncbi:uncharacterized protein LOC121735678 [Aricia agestis]|uniref:uncharacterized protein LOC121735678 n=1 Tax=Aricia agestis TaxID=91739 RepID=UPI001C204144|nr:uncharacterized protein LOC121735678 [Aricia agestis]
MASVEFLDNFIESLPKYDDIEVEFTIEAEGGPETTTTKVVQFTNAYKRQVISVEDLRRLFQEIGVGRRILREENSTTTTVAPKTVTTIKVAKQAEGSDDKMVHMKDLKMAINDLEDRLMERFNSLKFNLTSPSTNETVSAKIYNIMDFIKIGRGEKSPDPRTDNLNWLKIKFPFKS